MVYSSPDMLALVAEMYSRRLAMVAGKAAKRQRMTMPQFLDVAPKYVKEGIKTVAAIHRRYSRGDYRHEDNELLRIEMLANWLIELHQTAGKHPVRPFQISQVAMQSKAACKPGIYRECLQKVRSEW